MTYCVAALYHFTRLTDYEQLKAPLQDICDLLGIKGTILLAYEGINGTVAGTDNAIASLLEFLRADPRITALEHKESRAEEMPFYRMKVRLKREIVTMGVEGVDPNEIVGTYVEPKDWNELITDPDVILIDTRNDYEVEIGTFKGAVNPDTQTFREFPQWVEDNRENLKKPKVAMFCTGGIRCEKASSFMKQNGFDDVYHLKGGILKYLETQPKEESLWEGDCFVFDQRVAVKHGLEESDYDQCYACRYPITDKEKESPLYVKGVSCPRCHNKMSEDQRARFAERQKQIELAKSRGENHIGKNVSVKKPKKYDINLEWTGTHDCRATYKDMYLHVEQMDKNYWWWQVRSINNELIATSNELEISFKNSRSAKQAAEKAAKEHSKS